MYSCVFYGKVDRVLSEWGDQPHTLVNSVETSTAFQQEMMSSTSLAASFLSNHLIILCDAEWTDYEPILSRTLFKEARPILVVVAACPCDSDMLPLVNLVRANERLSLLTPQTLAVGCRGFVRWDAASFRRYHCPAYNPFDPYPCAAINTTFVSKVCPVPFPVDYFESQLNRSVTLLVKGGEAIKKEVKRMLVQRGFQVEKGAYVKDNNATIMFECNQKVDEIHVLEPSPSLAKELYGTPSDALLVLYVAYRTPFEEPVDLKAYRQTFGKYVAQTEALTMPSLEDVVTGFFVTDPCWNVQRIISMTLRIFPDLPRTAIVEELARLVKMKRVIVDQFGTEGIVVRFLDDFFYVRRL